MLALSNSVLLLLGFVYRVLLGRLAGPEGMGVYTLVIQVYSIVMSVCVSGLCVGVTHTTANLIARGNPAGIHKLVGFAVSCFLFLLALLAVPVLLFRDDIATGILGDARTSNALAMTLACILLTGLENILKAAFNGARLVRFTAISEVGEQLLRIVLAWLLLTRYINGDHGYTAFLILSVMTLSEMYSVVFLSISYASKLRGSARAKPGAGRGIRKEFLKIALPSAMTAILSNVFSSISVVVFPSRLMQAGYSRVEAVSSLGLISSMVSPLLMLPSAFVSALSTLILPSVTAGIARRDYPDLVRKVNKGIEATGLMGLPATAVLLPYIPLLTAMLFGQTVPPALAEALALQAIAAYYLSISTNILYGLGKQKHVLILSAACEVLQLVLVWFMTAMPSLHVYGYIFGMLIGDVLRAVVSFVLIHKATHTRPRIFHAAVVPLACSVVLYACVRIIFFEAIKGGMTATAALLVSLPACLLLYFLLLRLLRVNIWSYLKRVVLRHDPAHEDRTGADPVP